jgi:hypothetical protein
MSTSFENLTLLFMCNATGHINMAACLDSESICGMPIQRKLALSSQSSHE